MKRLAVISPAVKLPDASLATSVLATFADPASTLTITSFSSTEVLTYVEPVIDRVSVRRLISTVPASAAILRSVETSTVPAAVRRPFSSTVNVGIAVDEPYEPAVTPVESRVVSRTTLPDPSKDTTGASTSPMMLNSLAVSNVVAVSALPVRGPTNEVAVMIPEVLTLLEIFASPTSILPLTVGIVTSTLSVN